MNICLRNCVLIACCWLPFAVAEQDVYQFTNTQQQNHFITITKQLRCTVCQNQALYDSMAPLAMDLKNEICRMLIVGKSEKEITNFLVSRYGDFIKYAPEFRADTLLLWLAPVILFSIGCVVLTKIARR